MQLLTRMCVFRLLEEVCMNEAIWLFSFRYFTISFVVPWRLQEKEEPRWFSCVIFLGFALGCLANLMIPLAYIYTLFKYDGAFIQDVNKRQEIQSRIGRKV